MLQSVSGVSQPILKEVLLPLTLGRRPLGIWVFVANITDDLILGLNKLRACGASVDIGRKKLRLAKEELLLCRLGAEARPSRLVVAKEHVIPAQ
jgi:hypothetical protein